MKLSIEKLAKIVESANEWTVSENNPAFMFRIQTRNFGIKYLFRREEDEFLFGGYQIKYVALNTMLAAEWIDKHFNYNEV